jgi:hypothetical protein
MELKEPKSRVIALHHARNRVKLQENLPNEVGDVQAAYSCDPAWEVGFCYPVFLTKCYSVGYPCGVLVRCGNSVSEGSARPALAFLSSFVLNQLAALMRFLRATALNVRFFKAIFGA